MKFVNIKMANEVQNEPMKLKWAKEAKKEKIKLKFIR